MKYPKKIKEKIIIDNGFKKIIQKFFKVKNGKIVNYLVSGNSNNNTIVIVLPIDKDNNIIYLNEFRYGPEKNIYNFPSGIKEKYDSIKTVKNELLEESGYSSNEIFYLGKGIIGAQDFNNVEYYIATNVKYYGTNLEESEYIETKKSSINDFKELIKTSKIESPLTINCFYLAILNGFIK